MYKCGVSLDKLNTRLRQLRISLECKKRANSQALNKPRLDGNTTKEIVNSASALIQTVSEARLAKLGRAPTPEKLEEERLWKDAHNRLWAAWAWIFRANAIVDPAQITFEHRQHYGTMCRRFGMLWRDTYTNQYFKSYYVHQLVFHGPEMWEWVVVKHGLTFGMLSTTAIELRHLTYGRPAHKKCMRGGTGGRKRHALGDGNKWTGAKEDAHSRIKEQSGGVNQVSYLVLRELLILDWSMVNSLCKRCTQFRRGCQCHEPEFDVFLPKSSKRRDREQYSVAQIKTLKMCERGCGKEFATISELTAHQEICEFDDIRTERTGYYTTEGGVDMLAEIESDMGSATEDLLDGA
jgi:hypothetical protein